MYTVQVYIEAYLHARKVKIARAAQGRVERAGYHLILSAVSSDDGQPCVRNALCRALRAGEIAAALELFDNFLTPPDGFMAVKGPAITSEMTPAVSGELYLPGPPCS